MEAIGRKTGIENLYRLPYRDGPCQFAARRLTDGTLSEDRNN